MSASDSSKQHLAQLVLNHPALPALQEQINKRLFDRWLRGTPEEQKALRDISDNMGLFFSELQGIAAGIASPPDDPAQPIDVNRTD